MFRRSPRRPRPSSQGSDSLFGWTIFIILLAGFALLSWIGSFYIFGHPENAFSYRVLRTLGKIEAPRRFELTAAPRGQFLDADTLFDRFGSQTPLQLTASNQTLLRNYLRNYQHTRELVPYVIGPFSLMGAFRLGPDNFFPEGVVALARSTENPSVLLEMVFPAASEDIGHLERMLTPGLDLTLARTLDLTAVINARRLPEGGLVLTAVPLLYGSYTTTDATGTFSLEPPPKLNVGAGLPILNQAAIAKATEHYQKHLQRQGLADETSVPSLMRVTQTEATRSEAVPVARAIPVDAEPQPASLDGVPVARAVPVDAASIPIARAEPVRPEPTPEPAEFEPPTPAPEPDVPPVEDDLPPPPPEEPESPPAEPVVPLEPFAPETAATTPGGNWAVYEPGRMPRGRLLEADAARRLLAEPSDGITYLAGDFRVSASGPNRAVLRSRRGGRNVRIVADFPAGSTPPAEGVNFRRDASRPFQITSVEESADGTVNIYVREITRP